MSYVTVHQGGLNGLAGSISDSAAVAIKAAVAEVKASAAAAAKAEVSAQFTKIGLAALVVAAAYALTRKDK
jgi:hypothetical protein